MLLTLHSTCLEMRPPWTATGDIHAARKHKKHDFQNQEHPIKQLLMPTEHNDLPQAPCQGPHGHEVLWLAASTFPGVSPPSLPWGPLCLLSASCIQLSLVYKQQEPDRQARAGTIRTSCPAAAPLQHILNANWVLCRKPTLPLDLSDHSPYS